MNLWTAIVVIVAIWGIVQIFRTRREDRRERRRGGHDHATGTPPGDAEARREIEDLRERIKVLEKITVDGREAKAIADEIERLRD
ncbi:hypothetical protein [Pelagerythrobacter marensis]|uniref:Uncharacterized protein n=1 Tax=Pelagerythrobacter marensis TaxID=543877 RepID=A0A0G3X8Y4_9SPHN|nr:hypothetical protein [Pelagerythrobacter marensis]AKM07647.1 hypothetical protein AM2010_1578 [Pelagerythrobacter marensis]